jgi:hypothetical protein
MINLQPVYEFSPRKVYEDGMNMENKRERFPIGTRFSELSEEIRTYGKEWGPSTGGKYRFERRYIVTGYYKNGIEIVELAGAALIDVDDNGEPL